MSGVTQKAGAERFRKLHERHQNSRLDLYLLEDRNSHRYVSLPGAGAE